MGWREDAAASAKRDESFRWGMLGHSDGSLNGDMGFALRLKPPQAAPIAVPEEETDSTLIRTEQWTWLSMPRPSPAAWKTFVVVGAIGAALYTWLALHQNGLVVVGGAVAGAVVGAAALVVLAMALWLVKLALAAAVVAGLVIVGYCVIYAVTHDRVRETGLTPTNEPRPVKSGATSDSSLRPR